MRKQLLATCILACAGYASFAQPARVVETLTNLLSFTQHSTREPYYEVLGYYEAGDGGGGKFKYIPGPTSPTNSGTLFRVPGGRISRIYEGEVTPEMFGARGSTNYPSTAEDVLIRAAIDYAEDVGAPSVTFGKNSNKAYLISAPIYSRSVDLLGGRRQQWLTTVHDGTNIVGPPFGAKIYTTTNFQADSNWVAIGLVDNGGESGSPKVEGLYIRGERAWQQRDPKVITQVTTNRLIFFVDPADLPDEDTLPAWCFFYDDRPFGVGGGYVSSVDTNTGQVNLDSDYGSPYATHADDPGNLKVGWTVVFTPEAIESGRLVGTFSGASSAYAGLAGIGIIGNSTNILLHNLIVTRNTVENFHTGIRHGISLHDQITDNLVRGNTFSSYAVPFPSMTRDTFFGSFNYFSAFPIQDDFTTLTNYYDFEYAYTLFGGYNMPSASFAGQITADQPFIGFSIDTPLNSDFGFLRVDQPKGFGVELTGGAFSEVERSDAIIDRLEVLALSTANAPNEFRSERGVLRTRPRAGTVNNVDIGIYHSVGANTNTKFDFEWDITPGDNITIGHLAGKNAAVTNYATGSALVYINSGGHTRDPDVGSLLYAPTAETLAIAVNRIKRMDIGNSSLLLDSRGTVFHWGANNADGILRTDDEVKSFTFRGMRYNAEENPSSVLSFFSTATSDDVYLGNLFNSAGSITSINFGGATTRNGTATNWVRMSGAGGLETFLNLSITNLNPAILFYDVDGGSDAKRWGFGMDGSGSFVISTFTDAAAFGEHALQISRTGASVGNNDLKFNNQVVANAGNVDGTTIIFSNSVFTAIGGGGSGSSTNPGILGWASFYTTNLNVGPAGGNIITLTNVGIISDATYNFGGSDTPLQFTVNFTEDIGTNYQVSVEWEYDGTLLDFLTLGNRVGTGFQVQAQIEGNNASPGSAYCRVIVFDPTGNLSGAGGGGGSATNAVTSVGLALPTAEFDISNSPVTSTGTLTGAWKNQNAGLVLASPPTSSGQPQFRQVASNHLASVNVSQVHGLLEGKVDWGGTNYPGLTNGPVITFDIGSGRVFADILDGVLPWSKLANGTNNQRVVGIGSTGLGIREVELVASDYISWSWVDDTVSPIFDAASFFLLAAPTNIATGNLEIGGNLDVAQTLSASNLVIQLLQVTSELQAAQVTMGGRSRTSWPVVQSWDINATVGPTNVTYAQLAVIGDNTRVREMVPVGDSAFMVDFEVTDGWTLTNGIDIVLYSYSNTNSGNFIVEAKLARKHGQSAIVPLTYGTATNITITASHYTNGVITSTARLQPAFYSGLTNRNIARVIFTRLPGDAGDTATAGTLYPERGSFAPPP